MVLEHLRSRCIILLNVCDALEKKLQRYAMKVFTMGMDTTKKDIGSAEKSMFTNVGDSITMIVNKRRVLFNGDKEQAKAIIKSYKSRTRYCRSGNMKRKCGNGGKKTDIKLVRFAGQLVGIMDSLNGRLVKVTKVSKNGSVEVRLLNPTAQDVIALGKDCSLGIQILLVIHIS